MRMQLFNKGVSGIQHVFEICSEKDISCDGNYSMTVYSEHLNFSLKDHLESLRSQEKILKESEILYILRTLVRASVYLAKKRLRIRSFHPSQIFVNSSFEVKVKVNNIVPMQQHTKITYQSVSFYSPEELQEGHHSPKSSIFELGMLLMECLTFLDSIVTYYNFQNLSINIVKLNNDIKEMRDKRVAAILSRMMQNKHDRRISFKELNGVLEAIGE